MSLSFSGGQMDALHDSVVCGERWGCRLHPLSPPLVGLCPLWEHSEVLPAPSKEGYELVERRVNSQLGQCLLG